jgi:hypothetical protein
MVPKGEAEWKMEYGENRYGGYSVLGPLCVLRCSSVVVEEDAFFRDSRGMGLCTVGAVR